MQVNKMNMKKLLSYLILSGIVFLNMGAGCGDKSEDPAPDEKYIKLLVGGRWDVYKTYSESESDKVTLTIKDGALGYKFYADGTMDGCHKQTCAKQGRWSYKVKSAAAGTGELTFFNDNKDIASVYGEKTVGHLEIIDDNEFGWVITGNPYVGSSDYKVLKWWMRRKP